MRHITLSKTRRFAQAISTPIWRWGALFLFWGIFHLTFSHFILSTGLELSDMELTGKQFLKDVIILSCINLLAFLCLIATHLSGLLFPPWRWLRILLWLFSFLCFGIILSIPFLDPIYNLFEFSGRTWTALAFLAQFAADVLHSYCEYHIAPPNARPLIRIRTIIGFHVALLPLISLAFNYLHYYILLEQDSIFFMIEKHDATYAPEDDEAIASDYKRFNEIEKDFLAVWKDGKHEEVFSKWLGLKEETKDKPYLESTRLHILIILLRDAIPDEQQLCAKIQTELREAETNVQSRQYSSTLHSFLSHHHSMHEIGICPEDEIGLIPNIVSHNFRHLTESRSKAPYGSLERCYRALLVNRINQFYQLKLKAIDTPLEELPQLEAKFDRWLASVPWNYYEFMPNKKCMDGVGVHINRYADLYDVIDGIATYRTADVAIALHLYNLKYGEWPDSLERLVPEFIPALPQDPFTNSTLQIAPHSKIKDAMSVFAQRKLGTDHFPDELPRQGFPVRHKQ